MDLHKIYSTQALHTAQGMIDFFLFFSVHIKIVCHSFDFITFKTAENEIAIIFIWAISKAAPSSESHYDDCRPWWLISTSLYSHRKIKHSLCWRFVVFERFPFIISNFVFNHAFSASKHSAVVSLETFGKLLLDPAISEK